MIETDISIVTIRKGADKGDQDFALIRNPKISLLADELKDKKCVECGEKVDWDVRVLNRKTKSFDIRVCNECFLKYSDGKTLGQCYGGEGNQ